MSIYNIKAQFLHSARSNILHNNKICYIYYLPLRITKNNYNITKLTILIALVYKC